MPPFSLLEKERNRYYLVLVSRQTGFPGEFVEGQGKSSLKGEGFPEVANKGAQFRLERQGVGLVPLPEVGGDTCTECGTLASVAHSAFECPAHTQPREVLVETLDGVC